MNQIPLFTFITLLALCRPADSRAAIPGRERTVTAAKTQVVFIGTFKEGPTDKPVRVASIKEFLATFGAFDTDYETALQVRRFFLNGGFFLLVVPQTGSAAHVLLSSHQSV
ncbi:MAG: hypothetical protein HY074_14505 [Deltaproteobacteria bacterium]|nr:hypothetical protein [Deltaproteobacteria bacterium]